MFQNFNQYNPYNMPQRASQSNFDWIMVQNINQVENVAVSPNMKAWIMVQNEPVFALRTADAMGLVDTQYYHFEKYEPNAQTTSFVTADQLQEAINNLRGELHESIIQSASNRGTTASKGKCIESDSKQP